MTEGGRQPDGAWWARPGGANDPSGTAGPDGTAEPDGAADGNGASGAAADAHAQRAAPASDPWAPPVQQPARAPDPHEPTQPVPTASAQPWGPGNPYATGQPGTPDYRRPTDTPFSSPFAPPYATAPLPHWGPAGPGSPGGPSTLAPIDTLGRPVRPEGRSRLSKVALVALLALLALVAGTVGGVTGWSIADHNKKTSATAIDGSADLGATPKGSVSRPTGTVPAVAASMLQRVVAIQVSEGSGSGFIIRSDGYIATNNHVVASTANGGSIRVEFQDGRKVEALIVGRDPGYDLAVLKVEAKNLPTVTWGDSDAIVVGDPVIAIGEPLGLTGTVTTGIVSALNRPVVAGGDNGADDNAYYSAIQTDAAINPGNSGGPLLDAQGAVIGVNSAISSLGSTASSQSGSIGLGFAIPSNMAKRIAEEIIRTGKAVHPLMGVTPDPNYTTGDGARIALRDSNGAPGVAPDGPAAAAGLQPGDLITKLDSTPVSDSKDLIVGIRSRNIGDRVVVTYVRGGQTRTTSVTLKQAPSD